MIPSAISKKTRSLIKLLLEKDKSKRIGSGDLDSEEIKAHDYFSDVNWEDVLNK